jgi:hypothetical protein
MKNQEAFKQNLAGLAEVFGREITPSLGQIYWTTLKEFSDEQVSNAITQAVATLKFFPKPAELREIITGTSDEAAHEAWGEALRCLERGKAPPEYLHEITRQLGGWGNLKRKTYRDLDFIKRDFIELYATKTERGVIEHKPAKVIDFNGGDAA